MSCCPHGIWLDIGNFITLLPTMAKRSIKIASFLLLVCGILFNGCLGNKHDTGEVRIAKETIAASLDSSFQLSHNQTAVVESESLSVKFLNVTEDSRCPVGVKCIWAGQAVVELEIKSHDNEPDSMALISQSGRGDLAIKQLNGLIVNLVKVEPPRKRNQEIPLSKYLITLNISRSER
jgi:hypothetical protein